MGVLLGIKGMNRECGVCGGVLCFCFGGGCSGSSSDIHEPPSNLPRPPTPGASPRNFLHVLSILRALVSRPRLAPSSRAVVSIWTRCASETGCGKSWLKNRRTRMTASGM
jgi:hypothetical protein